MEKLELLRALVEGKRIGAKWLNGNGGYYYLSKNCQLKLGFLGLKSARIESALTLEDMLKDSERCYLFPTQRVKKPKVGDIVTIADKQILLDRGFFENESFFIHEGTKFSCSSFLISSNVGKQLAIKQVVTDLEQIYPNQKLVKLQNNGEWIVDLDLVKK